MSDKKLVQQKLNEIHDAFKELKNIAEKRDDLSMIEVEHAFDKVAQELEQVDFLFDKRI